MSCCKFSKVNHNDMSCYKFAKHARSNVTSNKSFQPRLFSRLWGWGRYQELITKTKMFTSRPKFRPRSFIQTKPRDFIENLHKAGDISLNRTIQYHVNHCKCNFKRIYRLATETSFIHTQTDSQCVNLTKNAATIPLLYSIVNIPQGHPTYILLHAQKKNTCTVKSLGKIITAKHTAVADNDTFINIA